MKKYVFLIVLKENYFQVFSVNKFWVIRHANLSIVRHSCHHMSQCMGIFYIQEFGISVSSTSIFQFATMFYIYYQIMVLVKVLVVKVLINIHSCFWKIRWIPLEKMSVGTWWCSMGNLTWKVMIPSEHTLLQWGLELLTSQGFPGAVSFSNIVHANI